MENEEKYNIPAEKFEFAQSGDMIHDQKLETKPIGYFKDAMIRFSKNKASIVAAIIIIMIVLFALIVPLFSDDLHKHTMDTYYAKNSPRVEALYDLGFNGSTTKEYLESKTIYEYAKGVGAELTYENSNTKDYANTLAVKDITDSRYNSVIKIMSVSTKAQGKTTATYYKLKLDAYLQVGFITKLVTLDEYAEMHAWEEETGIQLFYPLVNSYGVDAFDSDPNYWYKMETKNRKKLGVPTVTVNGKSVDYEVSEETPLEDLVLEDNYQRDADGNLVFYKVSGVTGEQYTTRVLYYNYYRYLHDGATPNYIFGTDSQGYDLAYRMARGIQLSLLLSVTVSVINFIIGAIYGAVEGYYGGAVDLILERISDILVEVPFIVVATLFQMHLATKVGAIPSLIFAFIMTGWIGTASRVRTQFYRFKNQEYVMAARTLGAKDRRIIWKHIFPNTLGTIITSSVLVIPSVIFSESMLSYLGIVNLGGTEMTSLGTLLSDASSIWTQYPHLMLFPAVVISLLMICFNLFGNGLRDAFNPTLRGVEE